ncbi:hypothetical protein [Amycolatopsis albispora]|uniref:Uncharacterized protein n=1 Tax=Amycolatopsis albispora TaxID=1804986 RepID=A0A344L3I1_9PSEU|nr:hypothetical protein [Amycolatopsis albispora]AXB42605.1 hypothetical protein A4R43_08740 [Amycolatopsis albispora]
MRADGIITGRLPRNRAGVLVSEVDTDAELYDSTAQWRHRAMDGVLHSGDLVDDPRSRARTTPPGSAGRRSGEPVGKRHDEVAEFVRSFDDKRQVQ